MTYYEQLEYIKSILPELDLLKEDEFHLFNNEKFALDCIKSFIEFCNNASKKLEIKLNFAIQYDYTFNAKATIKGENCIILFNLGLIQKLELIVSDSIEIFYTENMARMTFSDCEKLELKSLLYDLCISYLFYHEFAHIMQMLNASTQKDCNFQEQYSDTKLFEIKNHIYELDADTFGISMSTVKLIDYIKNLNHQSNILLILNLLTSFLFSISNIIILFSNNNFKNLYYKNYSHPHPLIRILQCKEQVLFLSSINLKIREEFFQFILQRVISMINQIHYNNEQIDYSNLIQKNMIEMTKYINEINVLNESFSELTRFNAQNILNSLRN